MAGRRVGIPKGPDRGLTSRCRARRVRAPSHGEGRDLDRVFGGRASGRRGTLADAARLWARCREGDAAARCALIERFAALATRIARGMNVPVGAVAGPDDLESAALIGLIDAVDRFDPERGIPFEGYAGLRIRGAVLDELRRVDDRSRDDRRRARADATDGAEPTIAAYQQTLSLDLLLESGERDWAAE